MGYGFTHLLSTMAINDLEPQTVSFHGDPPWESHGEGLCLQSCCLISCRWPLYSSSHGPPPSPSLSLSSQETSWMSPVRLPQARSCSWVQTPFSALLQLPVAPGCPRPQKQDGLGLIAGSRTPKPALQPPDQCPQGCLMAQHLLSESVVNFPCPASVEPSLWHSRCRTVTLHQWVLQVTKYSKNVTW